MRDNIRLGDIKPNKLKKVKTRIKDLITCFKRRIRIKSRNIYIYLVI